MLAPIAQSHDLSAKLAYAYYKLCAVLPRPLNCWLASNRLVIWLSGRLYLTTDDKALRRRVARRDRLNTQRLHKPALAEIFQDYLRLDFNQYAAAVRCPCLIISGSRDSLSDSAANARLTAQFANAVQQIVPGADHLLQLEHPAAIAKFIQDF